jgi:hypothetical protein
MLTDKSLRDQRIVHDTDGKGYRWYGVSYVDVGQLMKFL